MPECRSVTMISFDHAEVVDAEPAATVVVLRPSADGFEALLLKRSNALRFMGGFWVFPGGKVDPEDTGDTPVAKARSAGVRELKEEAGLAVDADQLVLFSHWLTPEGAPRRFATWFFLVLLPADAPISVCGSEITDSVWMTPGVALERQYAGDWKMAPPTLVTLTELAELMSSGELERALVAREAVYYFPKVIKTSAAQVFLYPGDAGYAAGDPENRSCLHRTEEWADGYIYRDELKDARPAKQWDA